MSTIDFKPTTLSAMKDRISEAVYDPTLLVQASLETLQEMTNNEAIMLDPTHPAIAILEMGAVEASSAVQETIGLLRKQYPILAEEEADLYRHMSDDDYLNRFASPSSTKLTLAVLVPDVMSKLIRDEAENCWKATIPRDTRITVDGVVFTLCYPIHIRRYSTGAVQVTYDTTISSPIQSVKEIVISVKVRTTASGEDWMFFDIDVVQVDFTVFTAVIERIHNYQKSIEFVDMFHYARAFYRNENTLNKWVELKTTHTDQVYDPRTPTVLFQVNDQALDVRIPIIYFSNRSISGELRVDIYTTRGELTVNLKNYTQDLFGVGTTPIDEARDHDSYVDAFEGMAYYAFGTQITSGGKNKLSFEALRSRAIYNAIGPQVIPITNVSLQADSENASYSIVKDVDMVTNRVFLATRKLPAPSNTRLVTPANVGIVTFSGTLAELEANPNTVVNKDRHTLRSGMLFRRDNGLLKILSATEIARLKSLPQNQLIAEVNSVDYVSTPFYHVLDETGEEFDMRVYSLNQPEASDLSFTRINQSLQLFVNTASYSFNKTDRGYVLTIQTNSGNYFKDAENNHVGVQLSFNPYGETTYAYINGQYLGKTETNERIYEFVLETNYDLNADDQICITNAKVRGVDGYKAWISLSTRFNLLYHTSLATTNFEADQTDALLGKWILPSGSVGNSQEEVTLRFGYALSSLWRRAHSYFNDKVYRRYEDDVVATYEVATYDKDPVSGLPFTMVDGLPVYNTLHAKGDIVLDAEGQPVILHRKGDVVLDEYQQPMQYSATIIGRELDLMVMDARYGFADDSATVSYLKEVDAVITSWVTVDMENLGEDVLEKTKIFFYPKSSIGEVSVYHEDDQLVQLASEQTFDVVLYVDEGIHRNDAIRADIENRTTRLLDSYIDRITVNMTEVREQLRLMYGTSVKAFDISGLGGSANYDIVTMKDDRYRLALKKRLSIGPDKKTYVTDAVNFDFRLTRA